jgi:hypothetical protein
VAVEPIHIPPDAKRVARRALCLAAISGRALLEFEEMPREEAEAQRRRILTWAGELALEDELEPLEQKVLEQPLRALPRQAAVDASWRLEGLAVLGWGLGYFELPAYDELVRAQTLLPATGFMDLNRAVDIVAAPALLPVEELRELQQQCFAIHWRLRNFQLDKKSMDFRTFARECWFGPLDISAVRFCDNDLALGEVAIGQAEPQEFQKALSSAKERHLAINWLVDGGELYSETDTST